MRIADGWDGDKDSQVPTNYATSRKHWGTQQLLFKPATVVPNEAFRHSFPPIPEMFRYYVLTFLYINSSTVVRVARNIYFDSGENERCKNAHSFNASSPGQLSRKSYTGRGETRRGGARRAALEHTGSWAAIKETKAVPSREIRRYSEGLMGGMAGKVHHAT